MNIDAIAYWDRVRTIAMQLPGAEASTSYGTPAFKVKKKMFIRLKEDGKTLVVYTTERSKWVKKAPTIFYFTEHYRNYPAMLVNIELVNDKELTQLIKAAWTMRAPKSLLK